MSKKEGTAAPEGSPSERVAGRAQAKSGGDPDPEQDNGTKAGKDIKLTKAKG